MGSSKLSKQTLAVGSLVEGVSTPEGTLPADGSWVKKSDYTALFKSVGEASILAGMAYSNALGNSPVLGGLTPGIYQGKPTNSPSIIGGGGMFIQVQVPGTASGQQFLSIFKSLDGKSWKPVELLPCQSVTRLTYVNGLFFVLVSDGAYYSADGETWTKLANCGSPSAVAYGAGVYVFAQLAANFYMTTPDLVTFTTRACPTQIAYDGVAFGNGYFIFGASVTTATYRSTDGVAWTATGSTSAIKSANVFFVNGYFFYGLSVTSLYNSSTDGSAWAVSPVAYPASALDAVVHDGADFVFSAGYNTTLGSTTVAWRSSTPTGATSTVCAGLSNTSYRSVAYNGSIFLCAVAWGSMTVVAATASAIPNYSRSGLVAYPTLTNMGQLAQAKGGQLYACLTVLFADDGSYVPYLMGDLGSGYLTCLNNGSNTWAMNAGSTTNYYWQGVANFTAGAWTFLLQNSTSSNTSSAVCTSSSNLVLTTLAGWAYSSVNILLDTGKSLMQFSQAGASASAITLAYGTGKYSQVNLATVQPTFTALYGLFCDGEGQVIVSLQNTTPVALCLSYDGGISWTGSPSGTPQLYTAAGASVGTPNGPIGKIGKSYLCLTSSVYMGSTLECLTETKITPKSTQQSLGIYRGVLVGHQGMIGPLDGGYAGRIGFFSASHSPITGLRIGAVDLLSACAAISSLSKYQTAIVYEKDPRTYFRLPNIQPTTTGRNVYIKY